MKSWKDLLILLVLTLGTISAAVMFPSSRMAVTTDLPGEEPVQPLPPPDPVEERYGIPVEAYTLNTGVVRRNQTLSDLLLPHGVSMQQIHQISLLPDSLIDERRIRPGNSYTFFCPEDTLSKEGLFAYEKDPLHYVVVGINEDSVWAWNGTKPVETHLQFAAGTIETSLWESMMGESLNPNLPAELSEIYAWSIDFFGLQQGDRYKVIYAESYVDSQTIGIDRIMGAWFYHNQTDFWAVPFEQQGVRSFFDEEGNSLRKAFLKAPLRFSRISSGFTNSRLHPILKIRRPHHGVDYVAAAGTPVQSVGDGTVTRKGFEAGGGGNYITVKHNSVYSTTYMHLSRFATGIRPGAYVRQGDVIGYVGSTGLATGPHLDFRFYKNGSAVNPLTVEAPPVEPVDTSNREIYALVRTFTMSALKLLQE